MKNTKAVKQQEAVDAIAQTVDRIGNIKTQMALLQKECDTLRANLLAGGSDTYYGTTYRVVFTNTTRHTLDMKAVREKLSPQFIAAHTNVTHVTQMHVNFVSDKPEVASNIIPIK
jgi:hypothetical protein